VSISGENPKHTSVDAGDGGDLGHHAPPWRIVSNPFTNIVMIFSLFSKQYEWHIVCTQAWQDLIWLSKSNYI
jgi:hypothetical protein